jgi:GlpG protein
MRVIGFIANEANARRFSAFLIRQGIENRIDCTDSCQIWVVDEDRLEEAENYLKRFEADPQDALFNVPIPPIVVEEKDEENRDRPRRVAFATNFFLALCVFVYFLNFMQEASMRPSQPFEPAFVMTPIQSEMLFDLPSMVAQYNTYVKEHHIQSDQTMEELSASDREEIEKIIQTPFWRGIYDYVLFRAKTGDGSTADGPLFAKIREGQIWRLFTPCILHRDLIHILFNMIWLWVLGRPIEQRIGLLRMIGLTLIVGIVSNIMQYLMSGPFFLGYSGVVMGLAGFIWMRERIAPWEGYPLPRSTILFLVFFLLAMFVLQSVSFLIQIFTDLPFILNIANTAHVAGALMGALCGRMSFFAWRVK